MSEDFRTPKEYLLQTSGCELDPDVVPVLFEQTLRTGFGQAGFSLLKLGHDCGSARLRQLMLEIFDQLSLLCQSRQDQSLVALSMNRFNQQSTTKPHRDGGPPESLLLLGYEPTVIESQIRMADYSLCAQEMGLSPSEFLDRYNPMFGSESDRLSQYTTWIREFDPSQPQILFINNSSIAYSETSPYWQGVLHQATILEPREDVHRVVNSIQLTRKSSSDSQAICTNERRMFLEDDSLGRQYGRSSA